MRVEDSAALSLAQAHVERECGPAPSWRDNPLWQSEGERSAGRLERVLEAMADWLARHVGAYEPFGRVVVRAELPEGWVHTPGYVGPERRRWPRA